MEEVWKDIEGYEGLYQVSNQGRVRSCDRIVQTKNQFGDCPYLLKGRIIKQTFIKGYLRVALHKNKSQKHYLVHRLVAEAFIPNPNILPEVNHKSEIKTQNNVENLEWCDRVYNVNYGTGKEKARAANTNGKKSKSVIQLTLDNQIVYVWPSMREAKRNGYGLAHIVQCCQGERKTHKGYKWQYAS